MKTSKFTKFLPVALALMLATTSAFAEETRTQSSVMSLTVPSYTQIDTTTQTLESEVTVQPNYENITVTSPFVPAFKVYNNDPKTVLTLSAKTASVGGDQEALYSGQKDGTKLVVIFANTSEDRIPADGAITNINTGVAAAKSNANAIAFNVTPKVVLTKDSGATTPVTAYAGNAVTYGMKNGIYDFTYTFDASAITETFSTLDTDGLYKSTLTLTRTAP